MPGTIVSVRELGRTFEHEVSGKPVARRRWAVNLSDNTLTLGGPPPAVDMAVACIGSGNWGTQHPDLTFLGLRKVSVSERFEDDPYKVEVIAEYGLLTAEDILHPTSRQAVWSFESQPGEVPALFYYDGTTQKPLTNSAFDYFPGLTTEETLNRIKIQKNFASLGAGTLTWLQAQGFVNSGQYIGCDPHTLKVASVEATYTTSEFQGQSVSYWNTTATLLYRQSTHNLLLPDVGWNYIDGGQKRRAMVFDFQNNEWVASANPVGLNGAGGLTFGAPAILTRRVHPEVSFSIFGNPPL